MLRLNPLLIVTNSTFAGRHEMEMHRIIGIVGFVLVMAPFSYGIANTFIPETRETLETAASEPTSTDHTTMRYISYGFPLTISMPKFDRSVAVGISFMVDDNDPLARTLNEDIELRDGRFDAVIANAIVEAGDQAPDINVLRRYMPNLIRHAVNLQIGNETNPTPVREVLITSYAIQ